MKLELKHLSPYLPYGLQVQLPSGTRTAIMTALSVNEPWDVYTDAFNFKLNQGIKPILRPLSQLTQEILHGGKRLIPMHVLKNGGTDINEYRFLEWKGYSVIDNEEHETCYEPETMSFHQYYRGDSRMCSNQYDKFNKLFEWHFDVFSLLPAGLAIEKPNNI